MYIPAISETNKLFVYSYTDIIDI